MQRIKIKSCFTTKWQLIESDQPGLTQAYGLTATTQFMRDTRFIPQMVGLKQGTPGWGGPYVPPAYNKWTIQGWKIKIIPILAIEHQEPGQNFTIPYPSISDYGRHQRFRFFRDIYCDAAIAPIGNATPTTAAVDTWYNIDGTILPNITSDVLGSMHTGVHTGSSYTMQHRVKPSQEYAFVVNNGANYGGGQVMEFDQDLDLFNCIRGGLIRNLTYLNARATNGDQTLTYQTAPNVVQAVNVNNSPTGFNTFISPIDLPLRTGAGTTNVIYIAIRIECEFYVKLFDLRNWSGTGFVGRGGMQVLLDEHALATGVLPNRWIMDEVQMKRFNVEPIQAPPDPNIHTYNDEEATKGLEKALAQIKAREERKKRKLEEESE